MAQKQLNAMIDEKIKAALDNFCEEKSIIMNKFLEEAILDKLSESEEIIELNKIRNEAFKPFDEVLKELKATGKL